MGLDSAAITLVLFAAVLHAGWNALVKSAADRVMMFSAITIGCALLALAGLPFVEAPAEEAWGLLLASVLVHCFSYVFLMYAYKYGDLSHVYPLARGSAPLLVAVGGYLFAGEALSPVGAAAVGLTSFGIMMLAFEGGLPRGRELKPVFFALMTGFLIASYTVIDGLGARASGSALGYVLWLFVLEAIPFAIWVFTWCRPQFLGHVRRHWRISLGGAAATGTAYGLVVFALSLGSMATVSSLRETSTVLATVIGAFLLKESFSNRRYMAAGLVSAGVIMLNGFG